MSAILPVYSTRAWLEEVGVPTSSWTATRVNRLLAQIGNYIDRVTEQRFICYEETIRVSGEDRLIVERTDRLPILSLSEVSVDSSYTTRVGFTYSGLLKDVAGPEAIPFDLAPAGAVYSFPEGSFALKPQRLPRYVESVSGIFPGGSNNIIMTGVFGWPELSSVKSTPFSTTTTSAITTTSTTIALTSVTGLKIRDVLIIDGHPFIVQSISSLTVTVDAPTGLLSATIAPGAVATAYAAVPYDIERVVSFLAMREVLRQGQWAQGNMVDPSIIKKERTDKYEYEVFSPSQMLGFGKAPGMTGIGEIDQILMDYTAPPYVGFA